MRDKKKKKEFVLSDNSVWTANTLAKKLNISSSTARQRLKTYSDVDIVMRECERLTSSRKHKSKTFELSDGSVLDARSCAERFDIHPSTMYARLSRGIKDVDKLGRKIPKQNGHDKQSGYLPFENQTRSVSEMVKKRNYFDPLSRLLLKTI